MVVDAKTLAAVLKISLRSAQQVLQKFASAEYGGMAERRTLIAGLERMAAGEADALLFEQQRRAKVQAVLDEARNVALASAIEIAPPSARRSFLASAVADLPATTQLAPGRLAIAFADENELWAQITRLTYARLNDEEGFHSLIQPKTAA